MSIKNYQESFRCPQCGSIGAIFLVKVEGPQIIIKQRCPQHGGRRFTLPLMNKHLFIDLIKDGIFRCFKCGMPAPAYKIEFRGPWIMLQNYCSQHRTNIKLQKIWGSLYIEAASLLHTNISSQLSQEKFITKNEISEVDFSNLEAPKKEPFDLYKEGGEEKIENEKKLLICPNCGSSLEGKERFCGTCGAEIPVK